MPSPNYKPRSSSGSLSRLSTGAAIRRGELRISEPIPLSSAPPGQDRFNVADVDTIPPGLSSNDIAKIRKSSPGVPYHRKPSSGQIDLEQNARVSAGPSFVPSQMSTTLSKSSLSQKKNSGFRATLKRVFGSKRQKPSLNESRHDYHRSDPGNLPFLSQKQPVQQVTRRPSQPLNNVSRTSALGSHSTYLPAAQHPNIAQEGSDVIPRRRRRNTLPSLVLSEQEARILTGKHDDLIARMSGKGGPQSSTHDHYDVPKRRSRSAEVLADSIGFTPMPATTSRDRENEIAFWRRSVIENPVPTYSGLGSRESTQSRRRTPTRPHPPTLTPIQAFDFGLDDPVTESANLEQRVNTLEIKIFDFEYALAKIQGNNLPKPIFNPRLYKRRSVEHVRPGSGGVKSTAASSSTHDLTFLASPGESSMMSSPDEEALRQNRSSKGTETTTIRPSTAKRQSPRTPNFSSPSSIRLTSEQYDTLMCLIQQEQCARQQLQTQVLDLQRDVDALKSPIYATIRPANYPTPSPESVHDTPVAPKGKTLHRSPPFQLERPQHETSRFSMTDAGSDTTEDGYQDVFETPRENQFAFESPRISPIPGMI